jgi:hypothetical protein
MKIAFTICSNNYLSQAKTLGDSLVKHNPDYKFIIGLCDKKNESIDYTFFEPYEIIEIENIGIDNFDWMIYNYDIIELNTASKPFFFEYLIKKYANTELIMYFDPDIKIFDSLNSIELEIKGKNILLTPHILTPIPFDNKIPTENVFLNYGLYNLGFLALRPNEEVTKFLQWWQGHLAVHSFNRVSDGFFVDQLPINFAPLFFKGVHVSRTLGYNFAYWNFHERKVSYINNKYYINENHPLIFMHFSAFAPNFPLTLKHTTRYQLEENTHIYNLFLEYANLLIENQYNDLKKIECFYVNLKRAKLEAERQEQLRLEDEKRIEALKNEKLKMKIHRKLSSIYFRIIKL